ncbi:cupin domain-containing protein [Mucilaginibacter ginsenosidivorax]|uniref:Cupin domain-containing protein n=1 Tax=Mucilaginibacter ginsenosidivorax TaxID=862126 RepID=A0A5B8W3W6_9SPHI|nr:cupin domain-containing protein [Mucilaginibacter ginsenosidivorax]QEC78229.1 cupin domain-containing protein [Mucilaginibacter ginsenosidivorax]
MDTPELTVIDIAQTAATNSTYTNIPVALVNDHVVRMSIMTEPYFWHFHPDSDESFLIIEGSVFIDLEDRTIELLPNQLFTIPKNVKHRTRPNGNRSVNLTFESAGMTTVRLTDR